MHNRQKQAERRCTLEHEKIHIERADMGKCRPELERDINQEVARRLITFEELMDAAMAWPSEIEEIADELFVRPDIARPRIDILRPAAVAIIAELIADLRDEGTRAVTVWLQGAIWESADRSLRAATPGFTSRTCHVYALCA